MAQYEFDVAEQLGKGFTDYAKQLNNADRIRLAGYLLGLTNAVQQHADISQDALWHAQEETMLFQDAERGDGMDPGYYLHNTLDNMADDFDTLADIVAEDEKESA